MTDYIERFYELGADKFIHENELFPGLFVRFNFKVFKKGDVDLSLKNISALHVGWWCADGRQVYTMLKNGQAVLRNPEAIKPTTWRRELFPDIQDLHHEFITALEEVDPTIRREKLLEMRYPAAHQDPFKIAEKLGYAGCAHDDDLVIVWGQGWSWRLTTVIDRDKVDFVHLGARNFELNELKIAEKKHVLFKNLYVQNKDN